MGNPHAGYGFSLLICRVYYVSYPPRHCRGGDRTRLLQVNRKRGSPSGTGQSQQCMVCRHFLGEYHRDAPHRRVGVGRSAGGALFISCLRWVLSRSSPVLLFVYDSVSLHPRVTNEEADYISAGRVEGSQSAAGNRGGFRFLKKSNFWLMIIANSMLMGCSWGILGHVADLSQGNVGISWGAMLDCLFASRWTCIRWFQSLFFWNGLWDVSRQDGPPGRDEFQSLFFWNGLWDQRLWIITTWM